MPFTTAVVIAAGAWLVMAAAWLVTLPSDARAKTWHYIHAPLPLLIIALYFVAPDALRMPLRLFLTAGAVVFAIMVVTWAVGEAIRNHGIMDIVYPLVPASIAIVTAAQSPVRLGPHTLLTCALILIWAIRLAIHVSRANLGHEPEPYSSLRRRFGSRWFVWGFFNVHMLQGMLCWLWSAPIVFALAVPDAPFGPIDALATAVWLIGFAFQAIGDWQLIRFKSNPANKGKLMQTGLWSMTRHPNYFGEVVMWWAYFILALVHPLGWLTLLSPLYTTWFMASGSAVPGKERHMRKTRPEYEEYARRVPKFFPRLVPSRRMTQAPQ